MRRKRVMRLKDSHSAIKLNANRKCV